MSFAARYRGQCAVCDEIIVPGQRVEFDWDHNLQHVMCPDSLTLNGKPRAVCPKCFVELPVTGVCDECEY